MPNTSQGPRHVVGWKDGCPCPPTRSLIPPHSLSRTAVCVCLGREGVPLWRQREELTAEKGCGQYEPFWLFPGSSSSLGESTKVPGSGVPRPGFQGQLWARFLYLWASFLPSGSHFLTHPMGSRAVPCWPEQLSLHRAAILPPAGVLLGGRWALGASGFKCLGQKNHL